MADDILCAYATAQIMVADSASNVTGTVNMLALKISQSYYIHAVVVVNRLVLFAVLLDGWRTGEIVFPPPENVDKENNKLV